MDLLPFVSALWFGILTSIAPCPLATNVAATTFIGKQIESRYGPLIASLAYTLGRSLAYIVICFILVASLFSIAGTSMFLQEYMNKLLGPVLIVVGLVLLNLLPLPLPSFKAGSSNFTHKLSRGGVLGGVSLGFVFALAFCPVSAALYFGSVIPLALKFESSLWLPLWYGIGTALPVIGFALVLGYGSRMASSYLNGIAHMEKYLRILTALVFVGVGVYFSLNYLLGISLF